MMNTDDATDMFMRFLGFKKISIGHFGTADETHWQKDNEEWLEKMCLHSVGDYFVRTETCDYHEVCDVRVWRSWRWIMQVLKTLDAIEKMPTIVPDLEEMYKRCVDIVRDLNRKSFLEQRKIDTDKCLMSAQYSLHCMEQVDAFKNNALNKKMIKGLIKNIQEVLNS